VADREKNQQGREGAGVKGRMILSPFHPSIFQILGVVCRGVLADLEGEISLSPFLPLLKRVLFAIGSAKSLELKENYA
jgi:hypothetical protein